MRAIDILDRCRDAQKDIKGVEQRIERRRDALYAIAAPAPDKSSGGRGTPDPDKPGRLLADIESLEQQKRVREEEQRAELTSACLLLDMLPETESDVLHRYYIKRQSLPAIARKMAYSDGYARKIKSDAEALLRELPADAVDATLPAWYLRREAAKEDKQ